MTTWTDTSTAAIDAAAHSTRWIRRLVIINLALVGVQALSAGFLTSGYARALSVHASVAVALQVGVLIQAVAAVGLWRQRRAPAWATGMSIALFVIVFLQSGVGYRRAYWLHVPTGVGIFGALTRQADRLLITANADARRPGRAAARDAR